jgi:hypothetical protein
MEPDLTLYLCCDVWILPIKTITTSLIEDAMEFFKRLMLFGAEANAFSPDQKSEYTFP